MKTHTVEPGDSLSGIAGYPDEGWQERLDQLIAANPDYPGIKNRTPDDPKYGWLEVGDEINVPITLSGESRRDHHSTAIDVIDRSRCVRRLQPRCDSAGGSVRWSRFHDRADLVHGLGDQAQLRKIPSL